MRRASSGYGLAVATVFLLTTSAIPAGATTSQSLTGVRSMTSNYGSSCALLASGKVDCWGYGNYGALGNGTFYTTGNGGSAVPMAVKGLGGAGTLSGVASLVGDGGDDYCALLTSGKVDCWGYGLYGQLGNGKFYTSGDPYNTGHEGSAVPTAVKAVGGTGILSGVASLTSDGISGYCALLTSGKVDCWGYGNYGELGNGTFYTTGNEGSDIPVAVKGVGGTGALSGVASLTGYGINGVGGYCALLTSRKVDCWGSGGTGQLGNGKFYTTGNRGSAVPAAVKAVGGTGTLSGVASLTSNADLGAGYCALLTSGKVDCWGYGNYGELGNGTFYTTGKRVPTFRWPSKGWAELAP